MKVTALDCACIFVTGAGNSLMTHNTKAEGTDEPDKKQAYSNNRHAADKFTKTYAYQLNKK